MGNKFNIGRINGPVAIGDGATIVTNQADIDAAKRAEHERQADALREQFRRQIRGE